MEHDLHTMAPHDLPFYMTSLSHPDPLLIAMGIFLLLSVIGVGVLYFRLHALPEHLAHRGQKVQFQLVAVLALIALFTHNHIFWIAALLLALVPLPEISSPLLSIARSLAKLSGRNERDDGIKPYEPPEPEHHDPGERPAAEAPAQRADAARVAERSA